MISKYRRYLYFITTLIFLILLLLYYNHYAYESMKATVYVDSLDEELYKEIKQLPVDGPYKIPRILHQTWKTESIPNRYVKNIKSFVENHPKWEYWFWTDDQARELIKNKYPHYLALYDSYPFSIERVDIVRYFILYEYGGVYADLDLEFYHPLDPLNQGYSCVLSQEPELHPVMDSNREKLACNALMMSTPKHQFFHQVLKNAPLFSKLFVAMDRTGPHFLNINYDMYVQNYNNNVTLRESKNSDIFLAPSTYFMMTVSPGKLSQYWKRCREKDSLSPLQQQKCQEWKTKYNLRNVQSKNSFTEHHWSHSWKGLGLFQERYKATDIKTLVPNAKVKHFP